MPVVPASARGAGGPSNFDKWKLGAMMGGSVGVIIGFIFGATNIMRFGAGPNGVMRSLGQYMLGSGLTFGFFMSIGTVIRTDASPLAVEAFARVHSRPVLVQRARPRPITSSTDRPWRRPES